MALITTDSANWKGLLTDITASDNSFSDADGLYIETKDHAISDYEIICSSTSQELSACSFENNGRNGLFAYAKRYVSELSVSINGYTATNNGKNGFYLYADDNSKLEYTITHSQSLFHHNTRGWEYGNGMLAKGRT
jgi:hypothetical protein